MLVYKIRLKHKLTHKYLYKIGYTQKKVMERFSDPMYSIFDIVLLDHIYFSRPSWFDAKNLALKVESEATRGFKKPSSFMIEEYLGLEPNALNDQFGKPMSGITEMFVLETPERLQQFNEHFNNIKMKYHEGN
jgi:hypothetical protein